MFKNSIPLSDKFEFSFRQLAQRWPSFDSISLDTLTLTCSGDFKKITQPLKKLFRPIRMCDSVGLKVQCRMIFHSLLFKADIRYNLEILEMDANSERPLNLSQTIMDNVGSKKLIIDNAKSDIPTLRQDENLVKVSLLHKIILLYVEQMLANVHQHTRNNAQMKFSDFLRELQVSSKLEV